MQASFEKAKGLPPDAFDLHRADGLFVFLPERPKYGRGQIFATFSGEHPEFQLHRDKLADSNSLKFNHFKHFTGAIPMLDGHKLDCKDCHRPDSAGKYFQRIAYETHCQSCHSLQFDGENPSLTLPHGDVSAVRAFLRTLPVQYADLARNQGLTREAEVERFAQTQIARLRRLAATGENLEQQIFYTADPAKPLPTAANAPAGRAKFAGCAYCHEVKATRDGSPSVTRPRIPDRWMPLGEFNHSKHTNVSCTHCHAAEQSQDTSDILVPNKASCATCHSPRGGTSESCAICHTFHTAADKPSAMRRR